MSSVTLTTCVPADQSPNPIWEKMGIDVSKTTTTTIECTGLLVEGRENAISVLTALTPARIEELCANNATMRLVVRIEGMADSILTLHNKGHILIHAWKEKFGLNFELSLPHADEATIQQRMSQICKRCVESAPSWDIGDETLIRKCPSAVFYEEFPSDLAKLLPKESNFIDFLVCKRQSPI